MMHKALFVLLVFCFFGVSAQSREGDLRMEKAKIYLDNKLLKPKEVLNVMEGNPEAYAAYKKAKSNYDAGQVIGFIGGFMIGYPLGSALGGGDPHWGVAAGGVGLLLLNFPLSSAYKKHSKNAIELYNGRSESTARNYSIEFTPTATGAKVVMRF
jgi:hypothetical protein